MYDILKEEMFLLGRTLFIYWINCSLSIDHFNPHFTLPIGKDWPLMDIIGYCALL
jgi:hypothetical protein